MTNLRKIETEISTITRIIGREDAIALAEATRDRNRIHHDPKEAAKLKLKDILVVGTYLSSGGAKIPNHILNLLRGKDPSYNFLDQEVAWDGKTFPGDEISWRCDDSPGATYDESTGIVTIKIIAESKGTRKAKIVTRLSTQRPIIEPIEENRLVYEEEIEINPQDIRNYKAITGESEGFPVAIIPGRLVNYVERLNNFQGTDYIAFNSGMTSKFVNKLSLEEDLENLKIRVYEDPANHIVKKRTAIYGFRAIASQDEKIITDTKIKGFVRGHFDNLYALVQPRAP